MSETASPQLHLRRRVPETGTLLGIWAHPDDEAFLSSALMAVARQRGERVVVATATLGEQEVQDPEWWPPARLAGIRRRDLADSLAVLGVTEHRLLGYGDGMLAQVRAQEAARRVTTLLEGIQPDTVVTFGPDRGPGDRPRAAARGDRRRGGGARASGPSWDWSRTWRRSRPT